MPKSMSLKYEPGCVDMYCTWSVYIVEGLNVLTGEGLCTYADGNMSQTYMY